MTSGPSGPVPNGLAATGHERLAIALSLGCVAILAWVYLLVDARGMAAGWSPSGLLMVTSIDDPWSLLSLGLAFLMWSVMMVGMMLPSAMPALLLYGKLVTRNLEGGSSLPAVWTFAGGYLACWSAFSVVAVAFEAALQSRGLLTPMLESTSRSMTGALLIAAGLYQWLPIKHACLRRCRAPLQFILMNWRSGRYGAFRMGMHHGAFCVGCCWVLMLLLFATGVMDLLWVAIIAALVMAEKLVPFARIFSFLIGVILVSLGVAIVVV